MYDRNLQYFQCLFLLAWVLGSQRHHLGLTLTTSLLQKAARKQLNKLSSLIGGIKFASGRWSLGFSEAALIVVPIT